MIMAEDYSRTPSLTNSEETIASGSDSPARPIRSRPLPQLPPVDIHSTAKGKERATLRVHSRTPRPASVTFSVRTSRSSFLYGHMHGFVNTWSHPRILRYLLSCVGWAEFHAVTRTCRDVRHLFRDTDVKNVVLSRFVPGYRFGAMADHGEEVRVSLADLEALMLSQSLPLHRYPMHAVYMVSAEGGLPPPAQGFSDRLAHLAQAHSRFVLLLRSRAPRWQVSFDSDDLFIRQINSQSGLRELTFPAPLSYFDPAKQKLLPQPPPPPPDLKKRSKRRPPSEDSPPPLSRPSSSMSRKKRLSIFGRSKERTPLPAPQSSPPSMAYYSSLGRARRRVGSMSVTDDESGPTSRRHSRFVTETLPPPRYPFADGRKSSSPNSSIGSLSRSTSSPLQASTSPHDLSNALSRTRAPILRVFVPCSTLASSEVLAAAEGQLFTSGLWGHLRLGDVVCNLGYVPEDSSNARGWLVFTGDALWPFFPPAPPPVSDVTALPSPLYYSHLLPPFENLRCGLGLPRGVRMILNLALLSSNIPSPHSHAGHVRVKKYAWLGRLCVKEEETEALGIGEGWAGEWVLEAEGTKEGRQVLVDAIDENERRLVEREWEIVREKSGSGRVWLRLISEQQALDNLSAEIAPSLTR